MPARLTVSALCAALLLLTLGAASAPAAKKKLIKASILGNPYVISASTSALPVLLTRMSAERARLKSPLGVVYVPRKRLIKTPDGKLLPYQLRVGDRFKTRVRVTREVRRAIYARIHLKKIRVYKRNK